MIKITKYNEWALRESGYRFHEAFLEKKEAIIAAGKLKKAGRSIRLSHVPGAAYFLYIK